MKLFLKKLAIIIDESELSLRQIVVILIVLAIFAGSLIIGGIYLLVTTGDFSIIPLILIGFISIPATLFGINPVGTKDLILRR